MNQLKLNFYYLAVYIKLKVFAGLNSRYWMTLIDLDDADVSSGVDLILLCLLPTMEMVF